MGKRGGIFFAIAAAIMAVIVWGNPFTHVKTALFPDIPLVTVDPTVTDFELTVDSELLMTHVNSVSQIRATPAQKVPIRRYLIEQLEDYGFSPVEQHYAHPETGAPDTGGVNIIGTLPGTDPDAGTFVLGAHYDGTEGSPGADDNGSAIATLLEAARLFGQPTQASSDTSETNNGVVASPFPRTLKLVFFDQEERQPDGTGLLGSLAFTQIPANIADVEGAIILDMVGYACRTAGCQNYPSGLPLQNVPDTGDFLAVLGLSEYTDLIGAFMGSAQSNWPQVLSLPIPRTTLRLFPDLARSDHAPFWEQDIPAVFVTDTANFRNANYHTARDTPETLDVSFFRGSAQHVVNATMAMLSHDHSE